ncbi:zinc finger, CCHC-type containing protein [Tanacetum coccineum]
MDYRLTYTGYPSVLECYTDARWISNTENNLSTSGWVFLLGGGVISWASKKQTCITGSTVESKFVALGTAGKDVELLRNLILEIPFWSKPIAPISIYCDSAATLAKAYSQMYNGKSRHLGTPYEKEKSWYENGRSWYENNQKREKVKEAIESVENDLSKGKVVSVYKMNSLLIQCRTTRSHYLISRLHNLVKSGMIDPTIESLKQLIYTYVDRKDVGKAYDMLREVNKFKMELTLDMFNAIMVGFINQTYDILLRHRAPTRTHRKILGIDEERKYHTNRRYLGGVDGCICKVGVYGEAEKVLENKEVPRLNKLQGSLVASFAKNGRIGKALALYKKIKKDKCVPTLKATTVLL